MLQEAPQKLLRRKRHGAGLAAMGVILPAKTHGGIRDREQAVVGDGDAMSVAGQIVKDMFWSAEGGLGAPEVLAARYTAKGGKKKWRFPLFKARSFVLQPRPNTFAQTILSLSFFACDKAADHTFLSARHSSAIVSPTTSSQTWGLFTTPPLAARCGTVCL